MDCVLGQHDETEKKEHAIYYLSKKFTKYESKYPSRWKKMCCALAWTAERLRQYLLYHSTWLISKLDPIKYIFEKPSLSRRIARWQVLLSKYDIQYVSQKVVKESAIAKILVDRTKDEYEPMKFEFSVEDLLAIFQIEDESTHEDTWKLYFDEASNVLGHGISAILISPKGEYCPFVARFNFDCTNNVA